MTKGDNPRLCGGTFFVLVLQALKQRVKARQHYKGERDGLSDPEVLIGLIKVINPDYQEPKEGALKGKTNDFKSCKTSTGQYVGSGFYAPDMIDGAEKFTAIFVHKTLFGPPSKTLQTMGEQINFQTPTTSGEALVDDAGHLMEWKSFDTEAEAIAWLDACFTTEPTVVTEGG